MYDIYKQLAALAEGVTKELNLNKKICARGIGKNYSIQRIFFGQLGGDAHPNLDYVHESFISPPPPNISIWKAGSQKFSHHFYLGHS